MSSTTKAIVMIGLIMAAAVNAINVIIPYLLQNVYAFSLKESVNKLFGFFQKPNPKQSTTNTTTQHPTQTQQNANNANNASIARSSPAPKSSSHRTFNPQTATTTSNTESTLSNTKRTLSRIPTPTIPSECHIIKGGLPDPKCTPGAINPSVTQDNIKDTICVPGYTKTIRPLTSYTTPLKTKLMKSYGFSDSRFNYEFDHLIPLEVGGHPTDVKNLFPEPGYGKYNFHIKDRFENYLHDQVCSGSMGLSEAQREIATDWISSWIKAGQP
ncbi:MAG TPA: hypothetical protein VFJ05_06560 [Nitrososphaeraceae archaeon]|nr:hypothetical protein [Nitrososphaeraceae archaeon]